MKRPVFSAKLAVVAAGTVMLAGCFGGSAGSDTDSAGAGASPTVLNVTISAESDDFNPFLPSQIGKGQMFDATQTPLVGTDDQGQVIGRLAESWEISPDGLTVTVTLKQDLTWSDGEPLTSADVAFSFARYLDSRISPVASRLGAVQGQAEYVDGAADAISGIATPDDSTVVFTLAAPNGAWVNQVASLDKFMPILPEHVLGQVDPAALPDDDFFATLPVGSGPFVLEEWQPGQYAHLVANENWWGDGPGFEELYMRVLDSDAAMAQLRTGETQFISPLTVPDKGAVDELGDGYAVASVPGVAPQVLQFNLVDDAMADPRVRQAIAYAVDREGICSTVLAGECEVPLDNIRQVGPEWALSRNGDLTEYTFDPDKARDLLAEAGWDPSTTLVLLHRPGQRDFDSAVNIIQANLADVGITVKIQNTDTANLLTMAETATGYQMFTIGGGIFTTDPNDLAAYNRCSAAYPAGANIARYCVDGLDALWDQGLAQTDEAERTATYHEIYQTLNADPDGLMLYTPNQLAGHDSHLTGVRIHGNPSSVYWNIGDWTWTP